jgi:hypothetical protein
MCLNLLKYSMMDILRWLGLAWFFDILPGLDLIPDRIRKIIAAAFFVPGAILTSIGWWMEQTGGPANSRAGGGFIELLMMVLGVFLMYISLCLWPWSSEEEDSQI